MYFKVNKVNPFLTTPGLFSVHVRGLSFIHERINPMKSDTNSDILFNGKIHDILTQNVGKIKPSKHKAPC